MSYHVPEKIKNKAHFQNQGNNLKLLNKTVQFKKQKKSKQLKNKINELVLRKSQKKNANYGENERKLYKKTQKMQKK